MGGLRVPASWAPFSAAGLSRRSRSRLAGPWESREPPPLAARVRRDLAPAWKKRPAGYAYPAGPCGSPGIRNGGAAGADDRAGRAPETR